MQISFWREEVQIRHPFMNIPVVTTQTPIFIGSEALKYIKSLIFIWPHAKSIQKCYIRQFNIFQNASCTLGITLEMLSRVCVYIKHSDTITPSPVSGSNHRQSKRVLSPHKWINPYISIRELDVPLHRAGEWISQAGKQAYVKEKSKTSA